MKTSKSHSNPVTLLHPAASAPDNSWLSDCWVRFLLSLHEWGTFSQRPSVMSPHLDLHRQWESALNTLSLPGHTMYHPCTTLCYLQKWLSNVLSTHHLITMTSIFGEGKSKLDTYLQRSKTYLCVSLSQIPMLTMEVVRTWTIQEKRFKVEVSIMKNK